ncbi:hypothetical protein L1887_44353 [Cichorium endivia]|nr:hypothetical protein L1887_44353 [Cichorium endivia]
MSWSDRSSTRFVSSTEKSLSSDSKECATGSESDTMARIAKLAILVASEGSPPVALEGNVEAPEDSSELMRFTYAQSSTSDRPRRVLERRVSRLCCSWEPGEVATKVRENFPNLEQIDEQFDPGPSEHGVVFHEQLFACGVRARMIVLNAMDESFVTLSLVGESEESFELLELGGSWGEQKAADKRSDGEEALLRGEENGGIEGDEEFSPTPARVRGRARQFGTLLLGFTFKPELVGLGDGRPARAREQSASIPLASKTAAHLLSACSTVSSSSSSSPLALSADAASSLCFVSWALANLRSRRICFSSAVRAFGYAERLERMVGETELECAVESLAFRVDCLCGAGMFGCSGMESGAKDCEEARFGCQSIFEDRLGL